MPGLELAGACDGGATVKFIPLVWAGIRRKREIANVVSTAAPAFPLAVTPCRVDGGRRRALTLASIGGLLPAVRAAGAPVSTALRAT